MARTMIQDMLNASDITVDAGRSQIISRRINLRQGVCRALKQIDVFDDIGFFGQGLNDAGLSYQFTVTTFPVIYNEMPWLTNQTSTSYAGERHVLYKEQSWFDGESATIMKSSYPNESIAADDSMFFFSPHVFLTLIVYNSPDSLGSVTIPHVNFSVYASLEDKSVDRVQYDIGVYQEYLSMMATNEMRAGSAIGSFINAGYFAPSWLYGGRRSSLMASVFAFTSNATSMFLPEAGNEADAMERLDDINATLARARTMVAFDAAFGLGTAPDWFKVNASGIIGGKIRNQNPPTKYADNGNTLML